MGGLLKKKLAVRIALYVGALLALCTGILFYSAFALGFLPTSSQDGLGKLLFLILLYIAVSMGTIAWMVGKMVGKPVHELIDVMKVAEAGDFLVRAIVRGEDEIGKLAAKFNDMLARITDLTAKNIDKERELILAKEELKYKKILEKKSRIIEKRDRELGARLKDLSVLYNINQVISSTIELKDLFTAVTTVVAETFGYREFAILLLDEDKNTLSVVAAHGFQHDEKIMGVEFGVGEGISGIVAETGKRIIIKDTRKDKRYLHYKGEKKEEGSFLSIPIKLMDKVLGAFNFNSPRSNGFSSYDIRLLTSVANYLAVAIENAKLYEKTRHLSLTDDLTGLVNKRHFYERLEKEWQRAERFDVPLALLMADIDHFKSYNDTYGHIRGDEALKEVASIFQKNTRGIDTVARFGGEEFVILLPQTDLRDALLVAEKLRSAIRSFPFKTGDAGMGEGVAVSIGVASYPETCHDRGALVGQADAALYLAKREGRNRVMPYQEATGAKILTMFGKS